MKRLMWDYGTINKINIVMMENDSKSCFDRIIVMIDMVHMRRLEVPEAFVKMWGDTYWNMKYRVKMAFEVSEEWYRCLE